MRYLSTQPSQRNYRTNCYIYLSIFTIQYFHCDTLRKVVLYSPTIFFFLHLTSKCGKWFDQCKLQQTILLQWFSFDAPVVILKLNHFRTTNFQAITQNRCNQGLFGDSQRPWKHVCIFLCSCICSGSLWGKNTDVSPAVCLPNPQSTTPSFSFSPRLGVSGTNHCLLCPPENIALTMTLSSPLYLHAGPQTSKQNPKSKANPVLFVFISSYLWPSDR